MLQNRDGKQVLSCIDLDANRRNNYRTMPPPIRPKGAAWRRQERRKTHMKNRIRFAITLKPICRFMITMPLLYATQLSAQQLPVPPVFGMIGIAASQTLRLAVVAHPPQPCFGVLSFADSNGSPVGPSKTVSLGPGQGDYLDLPGAPIHPGGPVRVEVMPIVTPEPTTSGGTSACQATAEIFDTVSGFSLVVALPSQPIFPGEPVFGLQGVAWGQVLRLNVVAHPPQPCFAQLSFVDANGNPAGPAPSQVNLGPGQAAFLDLAAAGLVGIGQRAELQPVVTVLSSATAPSGCVATAEVYDQFTGRTWTWQPADPTQ
jgi:hypothetical protein